MAAVLIVEDDQERQAVIAEVVGRLGHRVVLAGDGRAALTAAVAHRPDLIIADVDTPHLDSARMCRGLREHPTTADVPVVLITAHQSPGDTELPEAEAVAVVPTSFSAEELTETLRGCLEAPAEARGPDFTEALLRSLDAGVVACDLEGRLVVINQPVRDFFGDDSLGVPARDWAERFKLRRDDGSPLNPDDVALYRALRGEEVQHDVILAHDRQDRPRWFAVNARPVRDAAGQVLGAVAAVHDVTAEHHQRQYERCKSEVLKVLVHAPDTASAGAQVLRAMADGLGWPFLRLWLVDPVTDRLRPAATHLAHGSPPIELPSVLDRGEGMVGACWERGEPIWVPDLQAPDAPVLPRFVEAGHYRAALAVPVRSAEKVVGVLSCFILEHQDPDPALTLLLTGIAGHLGAYLERRRSEELSHQLAASVGEYIALVGHELRTPLTSIGTYTDLIAEEPDQTTVGEIRELLTVIERNNARLRSLVERLLDLSALETGQAELITAEVDLASVVAAAAAGFSVRPDLPERLTVPGDRDRLRQVAENLIGNAVKHSPEGGVVRVSLTADEDTAVLTVTDSGIGIPAGERDRLFARLYRASNARHSDIPGAGLGLALSRAIVELHGGSITLDENEGGGTVATVRLPRRPGTIGPARPGRPDETLGGNH
ncbi:response regulator [Actinoplanes hulinensis]|uniref:histidine kinase n=1 Tax=Actinoplanes hulinensis TaxID=1144547 RepID=A0ABS7B1R4_9ACTN|nr:ATP-binding protein [Actinoplanes hulinensis]MBW6434601.1 response regulator [Actinoplanes hulinensis]